MQGFVLINGKPLHAVGNDAGEWRALGRTAQGHTGYVVPIPNGTAIYQTLEEMRSAGLLPKPAPVARLWDVAVVCPPEGKERKAWRHDFVVLAESAEAAEALIRERAARLFASIEGGHSKVYVIDRETDDTVVELRSFRVAW